MDKYYQKYIKYKAKYINLKNNSIDDLFNDILDNYPNNYPRNYKQMEHKISFYDPQGCPLTEYIIRGIKTVEGRKNSPQYHNIKKGDTLIINDPNIEIKCIVTYVNKYDDVRDYLQKETIEKALPCVKSIDEGIEFYNKFTKPEERKRLKDKYGFGFLGIGIKLVNYFKKISLSEPWFTFIKDGLKTVEGRLNKGKFKKLKVGEAVEWFVRNTDQKIKTKIKNIKRYVTFKEMLEKEGLDAVLPNKQIMSIDDGVNIYRKYYSEDDEKKYGILAIGVQVIDN